MNAMTTATKKQVSEWTELLELLLEFLSQNKSLNDSIILMITRISMNALLLNSNELQLIAIQLLNHIFREYLKHRSSILEELLLNFHKIPLNRNKNQSKENSVLTKLLISLTNSLFISQKDVKISRELVTKQLTECLAIISSFLSSFLKKCFNSTQNECDLKSIFEQLINDLLEFLYFPQNISSILLIQILIKLLISNLNPTQTKHISLQLRLNSIEFLSIISSKFAKLLSSTQQLRNDCKQCLKLLLNEEKEDLIEILKLLNQYFNYEKLFSQKLILSSLWIKENKILEIESKFFTIFNDNELNSSHNNNDNNINSESTIDSTTAQLFIQYLELVQFSTINRLFEASLSHVTSSLSLTTNTTQRSKAMKCLSQILSNCSLEKSTQLLSRSDLQIGMKSALLDSSTSVREATIDLIGRFVLQSKSRELCEKYCDLIGERILDTGVSVRKRVIKILRDICIEFPDYEKNGEICVKIIKRVNDEGEGIRKLVIETCRDLWFQLNESNEEKDILKYKIMSLLHVISFILSDSMTTNIDSLQLLFEQIIKTNEKQLFKSSQIIIDFIVKEILSEEMNRSQEKKVLNLSAIQLLEMLSQINPELLVKHCETLQSLLSLSCDTLVDIHLKVKVIKTLERVLPKLQNPSQLLLLRIEEDLTKNILQSNALILSQSVKCLSVLIKNHTKNEKLSKDLFQKFQQIVLKFNLSEDLSSIPKLLRAIYSSGLFIKYFIKDFESKEIILEKLLKLINESQNEEIICKSIISLGFIIESDPKICLKPKVIQLYERILTNEEMKELFVLKVLNNFRNYLSESQESDELKNKSIEWKSESLKEMSSQLEDESEKVLI